MHPAITCKIMRASTGVTRPSPFMSASSLCPRPRHPECDNRICCRDLTIAVEVAALLLVCLIAECVQDIRNSINRKVERFTALIPKLMIAPIILSSHPDAFMPLSIGVKRGVVRYQDGRYRFDTRKSPHGTQKQKVFKHWSCTI